MTTTHWSTNCGHKTLGCPPAQDYDISSRASRPKPLFAAVTGRGGNPNYTTISVGRFESSWILKIHTPGCIRVCFRSFQTVKIIFRFPQIVIYHAVWNKNLNNLIENFVWIPRNLASNKWPQTNPSTNNPCSFLTVWTPHRVAGLMWSSRGFYHDLRCVKISWYSLVDFLHPGIHEIVAL